jgi:hypothetical protein
LPSTSFKIAPEPQGTSAFSLAFFIGCADTMTDGRPLICVSGRSQRMIWPPCTAVIDIVAVEESRKCVDDDERESFLVGETLQLGVNRLWLRAKVQNKQAVGEAVEVDVEQIGSDLEAHPNRGSSRRPSNSAPAGSAQSSPRLWREISPKHNAKPASEDQKSDGGHCRSLCHVPRGGMGAIKTERTLGRCARAHNVGAGL